MPILVRPVREQLEHDRIIRLLEAKWRRKFKVDANPGDERNVGVKVPAGTLFPDLILTEEGGRKPKALIEVETNESVNHLEAMAQWAHLGRARAPFPWYVPAGSVDIARRGAAAVRGAFSAGARRGSGVGARCTIVKRVWSPIVW